MLDFLLKGDADTMDKFIHSLRAEGQIHVSQEYLLPALKPDTQSRDGEWGDDDSNLAIAASGNHMVAVMLLQIQTNFHVW